MGEFEKINNIAKRLLIWYASNISSHWLSRRRKEDWVVVFRSFPGFRPRLSKGVGYPRHDCRRRGFLGRLRADGPKLCDPSGKNERHQVQKQVVHPNGLPDKVFCVALCAIYRILTVRFKGTSGTRVS